MIINTIVTLLFILCLYTSYMTLKYAFVVFKLKKNPTLDEKKISEKNKMEALTFRYITYTLLIMIVNLILVLTGVFR